MWKEKQFQLLKDEIEVILTSLADANILHELVREPLTKGKRALAVESAYDRPWPLLPLIVCEAISGHYEKALPAAATLQLFMAAGDVFDDIEDVDSSDSLSAKYGSAVATNVATTLLILAERAIAQLRGRGVEDYVTIRVMDAVNAFYTTACAGQHLDLSLSSETAVSEDTCLRVIDMKSASQVECACHIGALLANANQEVVYLFSKFGHNLGMAAQITNDIQGIIRGSDIMKHKITLPVIYALTQTDSKVRGELELMFSKQAGPVSDLKPIRDLLFRIGAMHYATVKMEFYKQRALDILSETGQVGANVERLKLFLE